MKISYLSQSIFPTRAANAVHVISMCKAFSKNGHAVLLNIGKRNFYFKKNIIEENFDISDTDFLIYSHWFPKIGFIGRILFSILSFFPGLIKKIDLYYSRHSYSLLLPALFRKNFIYEVHSIPSDKKEFYFINWLIKRKNFLGIVAISESLKSEYLNIFPNLDKNKTLVAHDGAEHIDKKKLNLSFEYLNNDKFKCGYAGHLYKGKGMELILNIAQILPEIEFHIFGGNDDDIAYWSNFNIVNIIFHGHHKHRHIASALNSIDVLLAPYQNFVTVHGGGTDVSKWMSPLKIFEYMSLSKPIICSDLPVLHEILSHNQTCLFASPDNPYAWMNHILLLYNDKNLRKRLGKNAYNLFISKYTWDSRVKYILSNLYKNF